MVGGLAALVGFAGAASANHVDLVWQGTGTNVTSSIATSINVVLDVVVHDTNGGGVTVDYGNSGKLSVVSFASNPDAGFNGPPVGTTTDTGTQIRNLNGLAFSPIAGPVRIGSIVFHKEAVSGNATLQSLYTATDTVGGVTQFGTAQLINAPEPGALALLAMGFGGLILGRNRNS
jgi:hypothetical protein